MNNDDINPELLKESKEILNLYYEYEKKKKINQNCLFFKYLNHIQFVSFIIPYLNLKDIKNLSETCIDINKSINSSISVNQYFYKTVQYNEKKIKSKSKSELLPIDDLKTTEEVNEQILILQNIKKYIQSKDFSLDNLIKIYRVEHDYLKYEERHMKRFITSLNETLIKTKKELKDTKKENTKIKKEKSDIISRENSNILEEDSKINKMSIEELKKKIDEMKLEIGKIQISYDNLIKENDILVQKNNMRNEQFSKIKNFFLNQSFNEESDVK